MDYLLLALFLASVLAIIIGLIKPTVFGPLLQERATRKVLTAIFSGLAVTFFILFTVNGSPLKQEKLISIKQKDPVNSGAEKVSALDYQLVYELSDKRYDGGRDLYVLINPVDLSSDKFKDSVKAIIRDVVSKKGNKISIEIHDKRESLDLSYKQYGDMSLGRVRTQAESDEQEIHYIAVYSGELETGPYINSLSFFPGASKDNSVVGKYVGTLEFRAGN